MAKVKATRVNVDRAQAERVAQQGAFRLVTLATIRTHARASVTAPVDTGNLRARHRMTVRPNRRSVRGQVISDADYSMAVHQGARPHRIQARGDGYLRFEAGGRILYRKSVNHPGVGRRPWLAQSLADECRPLGFRIVGLRGGVT